MLPRLLVLLGLLWHLGALPSGPALALDARLAQPFAQRGLHGVFVAFEPAANRWVASDIERASRSFLPASPFKIPNSLIALECGAVAGARNWRGAPARRACASG